MTDRIPVNVVNNEAAHRFEATVDGALAFAEYTLSNHTITFTHTKVPESLRGHGVANQLARTALAYAREKHLRVVPVCPFFAGFIKRHPEYQDLTES
jgi:uncharacterized protein